MNRTASRTLYFIAALALANMFFVYSSKAAETSIGANSLKNRATSTETAKIERTKSEIRVISLVNERAEILRNRWNALADRLEIISARISSLLDKMSSSGTDTTTAEALLYSAGEKLVSARAQASLSYENIRARAEQTDGTAADLYKIEKNVIAPEKEAVARSFEEAKNALVDVLSSVPRK